MSRLFLVLVAIAVVVLAVFLFRWPQREAAPLSPDRSIAALQARHPFTIEQSPEYRATAENPEQWRALDRREHFDAVRLTGDPALYRPLLDHLLHARDWTLVYLDDASFGFKRAPVAGWDAASLADLEQDFARKPKPERVAFLVALAGKLMAVDEVALAKKKLEEAVALDDHSAAAWAQLAAYYAQSSLWGDALERADKALAINPKYPAALATKAQVLQALHRPDQALQVSLQLLQLHPDDPQTLFQHANIAHEAHDYAGEVQALQRLVDLAAASGRPAAGYRIYLAQAYSRNSQRVEALAQFQQALESSEISAAQRDYVQEGIKRLSGAYAPAAAAAAATPSRSPE